jgi:hypothetical protein
MKEITGLSELVSYLFTLDNKPKHIAITSGSVGMRHGMWVATLDDVVTQQGYGLSTLVDVVVDKPKAVTDCVFKYLLLSKEQQEVTTFDVYLEEENMIKTKTKLTTPVGNRDVGIKEGVDNTHTNTDEVVGRTPKGQEKKKEVVVEPVVEPVVETEAPSEVAKPDFDHAASLESVGTKKESKIALEEYAREFGIELQRNKSFSNMLKDFKSESKK